MTLRQAFTEWAAIPQDTAQAARNRTAVYGLLLKGLGERDVRELTAFAVRRHFAGIADSSDEIRKRKVRSASILVQVLKYAAGKSMCVMPDFDHSIASTKGSDISGSTPDAPLPQPSPRPKVLGREDSVTATVPGPPSGDGVATATAESMVVDTVRDQFGRIVKGSEPWNKGKHPGAFGGRKKVAVVQLHPDTLEAVGRFGCMADARRETGAKDVFRAVRERKLSGGWFWCREGEEKDFKPQYKTGPYKRSKSQERKKGSRKPDDDKSVFEIVRKTEAVIDSVAVGGLRKPDEDKSPGSAGGTGSLSRFSDEQLKDELIRRGWSGTLYKRLIL